jgi:hypothetical protein
VLVVYLWMVCVQNFTGKYFFEELHGMSAATGVSFDLMRRIHMLGELTKGQLQIIISDCDGSLSLSLFFFFFFFDWRCTI